MWLSVIAVVVISYLLGNLNGAILTSRYFAHEDVREKGSGNAGLTNFVRNYGLGKALFVILLDACKTVAACLLGGALLRPFGYGTEGTVLGAIAVSMGHDFPVFFGFKGGKGIVCGATIAAVLDLPVFLILLVIFFTCFFITRFVSLSSILVSASFSICFVIRFWGNLPLQIGTAVIGIFAIWMHRENIKRLLSGTERKFSFGSKEKGK
ncbi:MAG: glycerol-3-phosphate 1-O-acyltransferase PlsY [Ruminococcaceae bacterium]|nr:glycerol-3-phosphate 1-O-acyltransferase PlsY [Oscillospiraceae bacterium]